MAGFAAYVINRKQDEERLRQFVGANSRWPLDIRVVEATDGHAPSFSLGDYARETRNGWNARSIFKPGAFACFLSHMKAWEMVLNGPEPHAFVFEDDAVVRHDPHRVDPVLGRADLVYANRRMSSWTEGTGPTAIRDSFRRVLFDGRSLHDQNVTRTFGGDCYLLTKAGAEALLAQVDAHGICTDVDYFLSSIALGPGDIPEPLPDHLARYRFLGVLGRMIPERALPGMILGNWLTVTQNAGSVLDHGKRVEV